MDRVKIELEALITVREGMIAENGQRIYSGRAPAYVGDNFQKLADQIGSLGRGGEVGEADSHGESGEEGGSPGTVYLVIQQKIIRGAKGGNSDIIGAFAVAKDGYGWIERQHNPKAYFLEPLKVIKEGG